MVTRRSFNRPLAHRSAPAIATLRYCIASACFIWACLAWGSMAEAQDYDAAGRHFAAGQERYAGKRFHSAALHFQAAYDITKDPVLLFNVGEAQQRAGQSQKAIAAYRAYLKEKPGSPDRVDVERRIALLELKKDKTDESVAGDRSEAEAILATGEGPPLGPLLAADVPPAASVPPPSVATTPEAAPAAAPVVSEPPAPKPPEPAPQLGLLDDRPAGRLRIAAWCSVAATIALLTTGAILGLAAQSRGDEIGRRLGFVDSSGQPREFDAGARKDFDTLRDEGKLYNGLAIGFFSAAGAMAITSTVLFIVDWKQGRDRLQPRSWRLAPTLAPGTAGLLVGGSF